MREYVSCRIDGAIYLFDTVGRIVLDPETLDVNTVTPQGLEIAKRVSGCTHYLNRMRNDYHFQEKLQPDLKSKTFAWLDRMVYTFEDHWDQVEFDPRSKAIAESIKAQWAVSKNKRSGYVYLAHVGADRYKIGVSENVENRQFDLRRHSGAIVEMVCAKFVEDMRSVEFRLHTRYKAQRIEGEWFALTPEDVAYIQGVLS